MIDRDDLKAFVDGELSPIQMAEIREAVDKDPTLAKEVDEISRLTHTIRAHAPLPHPAGLEDTLGALRRARNPWRTVAWPVAIVGACGVAFALVFPIFASAKQAAKKASIAYVAPAALADSAAATPAIEAEAAKAKAPSSSMKPRSDYAGAVNNGAFSPATPAVPPVTSPGTVKGPSMDGPANVDNLNFSYRVQDKSESRDAALKTGSTVASQTRKSLAEPAKTEWRDYALGTAVLGTPPSSFKRTKDSTIVLEVDSLDDARKRVAELVVRLDGTLNEAQAGDKNAASSQIEIMVPAAKAPEAIDVLKNVLPALSRREEATFSEGSLNRAPSALKSANEQPSFTGKLGVGGLGDQAVSGGFGGGGGRTVAGSAGPGTPPGAPGAIAGRNAGGGKARGGAPAAADASARRDRNLKTMSADTKNLSVLEGTVAAKSAPAPKVNEKKVSKPVLRRIVILLKKRQPKPNPTDHR